MDLQHSCSSQNGHINVVNALIEAQANVNYAIPAGTSMSHNEGTTALMMAANFGHAAVVKALLDANAGVFHTRPNGGTALDIAICRKHPAVISMLKAHIAQTHFEGSK